jgi:hypothetical protein
MKWEQVKTMSCPSCQSNDFAAEHLSQGYHWGCCGFKMSHDKLRSVVNDLHVCGKHPCPPQPEPKPVGPDGIKKSERMAKRQFNY